MAKITTVEQVKALIREQIKNYQKTDSTEALAAEAALQLLLKKIEK